jgi:ABC-type dipeptide/oligopeptide/nickel transport systems, permease components
MLRLFWNRLVWAIPVLLVIVVLNFVLVRLAPGDPITSIIGEYPTPEGYAEQLRAQMGLDRPIHEQLLIYLGHVFQGDLGYSFANRQPVLSLILGKALNTLALMVPGLIFASLLGILIGRVSLSTSARFLDSTLTGLSLFGYSVPIFWLGQVLIILFAVELQWLPAQGMFALQTDLPSLFGLSGPLGDAGLCRDDLLCGHRGACGTCQPQGSGDGRLYCYGLG